MHLLPTQLPVFAWHRFGFIIRHFDNTQVVLGVGLVALLANAIRRGAIRWVLLTMAVLFIGVWMSNWIIARDPFTTIIITQDISIWHQLALMAHSISSSC